MNRPHGPESFDWRPPHEEDDERSSGGSRGGGGGDDTQETGSRQPYQLDRPRGEVVYLRDDEMRSMRTVGAFRAVDQAELKESSLAKPIRMGLMTRSQVIVRAGSNPVTVVALSRKGRKLVEANSPQGQRYYSRICKPRELRHDLALYGAFREEAKDIEARGGKVKRVVLDYEFKSQIARRLNMPEGPEQNVRRRELADELKLPVIDDHLRLPDLRLEYEDEHGHLKQEDIELTTEHYRGAHRAATARSGFKLKAVSTSGRSPVTDNHHLKLFG